MRVTLLGHAALLVEMGPMTILMDPVLQDPFEDGIVVSCPKREIDVQRLPPVDVIILSHRHPGIGPLWMDSTAQELLLRPGVLAPIYHGPQSLPR